MAKSPKPKFTSPLWPVVACQLTASHYDMITDIFSLSNPPENADARATYKLAIAGRDTPTNFPSAHEFPASVAKEAIEWETIPFTDVALLPQGSLQAGKCSV